MSPRLGRIIGFRLVTDDLRRLASFYREVLGFIAEGGEEDVAADEMRLLGLAGGGRRQVLRLGEQVLALDRFELRGRPYPAGGDAASLFFQHLALVVVDIARSHARLRDAVPISTDGPQHLPPSSGGVHAFKFRDPDGHPLELLQFPHGEVPAPWQERTENPGQVAVGIDHSAVSVSDAGASAAFYEGLGLAQGKRTLNEGIKQQRLDGLRDVAVDVVPLLPQDGTPHLELLGYRVPRGEAGDLLRANDVAATRVVWRGAEPGLLADPDGHLHQIEA